MPKELTASGTRQFAPHQCQYPGGKCTNERAMKKNGERHWLCSWHRDHQNSMQRDRYRRTMANTKKDTTKEKKKRTEKATTTKEKNNRDSKTPKRVYSSPHIVDTLTAATALTSSSDDDNPAPPMEQAAPSGAQPNAATREVGVPAQGTDVPAEQCGSCSCACHHSPSPRPPQAVYVMTQAVPLPLGGAQQVYVMAQQPSLMFASAGDLNAATTQGRQVVGPQLQSAVPLELQSCVGLAPLGPSATRLSPSHSSVRTPEPNDSALRGDGCNAAGQIGQADSCRVRSI
jgi:hypothetical protein